MGLLFGRVISWVGLFVEEVTGFSFYLGGEKDGSSWDETFMQDSGDLSKGCVDVLHVYSNLRRVRRSGQHEAGTQPAREGREGQSTSPAHVVIS